MPTIKDVAERAGVSVGTVSNVINGRGNTRESTVRKVKDAMAEMNFRPNSAARELRGKGIGTIGLVIPDSVNPFFAETAWAVEKLCTEAGLALIVATSGRSAQTEEFVFQMLIEKRVDGLIVAPNTRYPALNSAVAFGIPTVLIDYESSVIAADAVLTDHVNGGALVASHLLELGHREFACISTPLLQGRASRIASFRKTVEDAGLVLPQERILLADTDSPGGFSAMNEILAAFPEITAVFASNDLQALGAIRACVDAGIAVPQQLSIVGYDNIAMTQFSVPRLSSVSPPIPVIVERALSILRARIENHDAPIERWVLPVELVLRDSTAPPRNESGRNGWGLTSNLTERVPFATPQEGGALSPGTSQELST